MPSITPTPVTSAESPDALRVATATGKVGLWDWNVVTNEVKWTDAVYAIHGVERAKFTVTLENFVALIHPDDRARVQTAIEQALQGDQPYELEFRIVRHDGKTAWVFTNGTVVRQDGRPIRMIGATLDVTASRRADEDALRLAAIVESSDDAIFSKNLDRVITSWNDGAQRLLGYTADEIVGRPVTVLIPAARQSEATGTLERIRRGEKLESYETVLRRKDGTLVDVSFKISPLRDAPGRIVGASIIARDITERLRNQRESAWLAALVTSAEEAILSKDLTGLITSWNAGAERIFGYTSDEAVGRPVTILIPANRQNEEPAILEKIRRGEKIEHYETIRRHRDGHLIDVSLTVSPIRNAHGVIVGASKIARDITDRKRAAEALQISEDRFRLLARHAPVGIFLSAENGDCVFVNQRWCDMTGMDAKAAEGDGWSRAIHPADREAVLTGWAAAIRQNLPCEDEFRFLRPDGSVVWVQASAVRFKDGDLFRGYLGSCVDITARKEAELQARFLQELSERIIGLSDPHAILRAAQSALGEHLGADRCYFYELFPGEGLALVRGDWSRTELPSTQGQHRLADFGMPEFAGLLAQPRMVIPDLATHSLTRDHLAGYRALGMASLATTTLAKENRRLSLAVSSSQPRTWTGQEMDLVENVMQRVWPAIERAEAEQALRASEQLYRAIGDSINYGVWVCDAEGRNLYASDSFLKLVGHTQAQCANLGWTDLLHPDDVADTTRAWLRCVRDGSFWEREHRFKGTDGAYHPVLARGVAIRDATGKIVRWVGINLDISAMKADRATAEQRMEALERSEARLRDSETRWRQLAEAMPHLVWTCRADGACDYLSPQWVSYTGVPEAEQLGTGWTRAVHPDDLPGLRQKWDDAVQAGAVLDTEFRIRRVDGAYRAFKTRALPVRDESGQIVKWYGSNTDIEEFLRARDDALAASRAKDDFLAALSHELRTPLNPVLLLASDAVNNPALPREIRETFELIRTNVSLEARLIDDLLDLTHIARGKMSLEKQVLDLHDVLRDAIGNLRADIEGKRLALELDLGAPHSVILGDAVRLQQVFWNLLKNAVKFTPEEGRIRLRTTADASRISIEITDTGIGLSAAELAHVFEAFAQGEHATTTGSRRYGGLGLGLAISHRLVELHAGRITAASDGRNRGSRFVIELPLSTAARAGSTPAFPVGSRPPVSNPAPAGDILLVEDHASTRETLQKLLTRRNYTVTAASSAGEARQFAIARRFDFLVSDVGLPDADGYQLMHELRVLQPGIQGIAISGYGMEDDIQRSQTAGFTSHLVKPVSITALENALAALKRPTTPA